MKGYKAIWGNRIMLAQICQLQRVSFIDLEEHHHNVYLMIIGYQNRHTIEEVCTFLTLDVSNYSV